MFDNDDDNKAKESALDFLSQLVDATASKRFKGKGKPVAMEVSVTKAEPVEKDDKPANLDDLKHAVMHGESPDSEGDYDEDSMEESADSDGDEDSSRLEKPRGMDLMDLIKNFHKHDSVKDDDSEDRPRFDISDLVKSKFPTIK